MNMNAQTTRALLAAAAVGALGTLGAFAFDTLPSDSAKNTQPATATVGLAHVLPPDPFEKMNVEAKAAYVYDASADRVLFAKNAESQLPLASVTKALLALTVAMSLDDHYTAISSQAIATEGDSGFQAGEVWRTRDLIDFTLMTSSNDGAAALAEAVEQAHPHKSVATRMNDVAHTLGLTQTFALNGTGLDEHEEALGGAYGSARNVALLFAHLAREYPDLFAATTVPERTFTSQSGVVYEAENTNEIIGHIPGLIAGKTGFTDLAGGNLAIAFESEPGHLIVVVVLGSTRESRFSDVVALVEAALAVGQNGIN